MRPAMLAVLCAALCAATVAPCERTGPRGAEQRREQWERQGAGRRDGREWRGLAGRVIRVGGEAAQRLSHRVVCSASATTLRSQSVLSASSVEVNRRGSGGRHGVCDGDALVTVIHDAFRPSVQSAQGSHQVQLASGEERAGKASAGRAKRLTRELRKARASWLRDSSLHCLIHS